MGKYYRHPLAGRAPLVGTSLTNVQASKFSAAVLASETFDDPPAVGGTGQIKVWNGGSFALKPVKWWNGSAFVTKPLKRWTGSAWVQTL